MKEDKDTINLEDLHFYYNREERIKRAPENVRSYYDGTAKLPPKGFFKALVSTRSSRFLLGSIVLLVIMILFVTNFDTTGNTVTVQGIPFELSAFVFEETVYVTVKATSTSVDSDIPVSLYVDGLNAQNESVKQASIHSIFDGNEKFFRTTFENYDIISIECSVTLENETALLRTKVQE